MSDFFSRKTLQDRCPDALIWRERGWVRELDCGFVAFLLELEPRVPSGVLLAALLLCHQEGRGHVCLDLAAVLDEKSRAGLDLPFSEAVASLTFADWVEELRRWPQLIAVVDGKSDAPGNTPMVLNEQRLYLRRYWRYNQNVRAGIAARLQQCNAWAQPNALRPLLDKLFSNTAPETPDWQKLACALATRHKFCVITGGPGRGKTHTVVKLLALALGLAPELRIRIAAPTGKAAVRLKDAIAAAKAGLSIAVDGIPDEAVTVHRLLGARPDTRQFLYHRGNPLPLDWLVVDEASMLSLELMDALLAALPDQAGLILLGDKDQLASVEAGAVLGALCARADGGHYRPETSDWLEAASGERIPDTQIDPEGLALDQAIIKLRYNHRSKEAPAIGALADAVNAGAVEETWKLLDAAAVSAVKLPSNDEKQFDQMLMPLIEEGYSPYLKALQNTSGERDLWAKQVLQAYQQFRLLCAVRQGIWGVEGINQRIARLLCSLKLIPRAIGNYPGRPLMVTRNDYTLGLMNGDIGVQMTSDEVAFPMQVGKMSPQGIRWVRLSRLATVETAYAMTVHKSQGSEFTHTALLLPNTVNPTLTRELFYTALTRSRQRFTLLYSDANVVEAAVRAKVNRSNG